jgi:hypothetical protein
VLPARGPIPLEILGQDKEISFFEGSLSRHDFPQDAALGAQRLSDGPKYLPDSRQLILLLSNRE